MFFEGTAASCNRKDKEATGSHSHHGPGAQECAVRRLPFEYRSCAVGSEERRRECLHAHHGSQRAQSLGRARVRGK